MLHCVCTCILLTAPVLVTHAFNLYVHMCIVVCGRVLALQCLYFLLATLCLHIYQELLPLLKTKVYVEAVGVLEQLVLWRDLISLRFVCICSCLYVYIYI